MPALRTTSVWIFATLLACGDVEPADPYVTSGPQMTTTSMSTTATTNAGDETAESTGTGEDSSGQTTVTTEDPTTADGSGTGTADTGCQPGTEGCPCAGRACEAGLLCLSEVCVDPGPLCPVGSDGCPCTPGGGCDPGLTCVSDLCVEP